jgi:thiamine biosynthesis protein ThiS
VNVIVNGRTVELPAAASISTLLRELGLDGPYALVERNGEPVERDRYPSELLHDGDTVVVARPVAGG